MVASAFGTFPSRCIVPTCSCFVLSVCVVRRLFRTRRVCFSLSFLVSLSCRYPVVAYRTDGRFVSSLIVSLVLVPRSSSAVRVNVRVIVRTPSSVVVVVASFIVRLAFLEVV